MLFTRQFFSMTKRSYTANIALEGSLILNYDVNVVLHRLLIVSILFQQNNDAYTWEEKTRRIEREWEKDGLEKSQNNSVDLQFSIFRCDLLIERELLCKRQRQNYFINKIPLTLARVCVCARRKLPCSSSSPFTDRISSRDCTQTRPLSIMSMNDSA